MRTKGYNILLPLKFLEAIIHEELPLITGFTKERLFYLIATIVYHRKESYPGSYSQLNMILLNKIVPRANEYMNWLKDKGYIEWINYSAGRNSRQYRIHKNYDSKLVWHTLNDQYLIRRIYRTISQLNKQNSKKYPVLNGYIHQIIISVEAAESEALKVFNESAKINLEKALSRYAFSLIQIHKIEAGEIYIKCSSTNGRLDTNFTRLPRELVQYLSVNGHNLFEIDISNSQPFFAACLFNPMPEIKCIIEKSHIMLTDSFQISKLKDVILYKSLVSTGNFYSFLEEELLQHGISFKTRDELKEQLFIIFFGKNQYQTKLTKVFTAVFPNVIKMFNIIKKNHHNTLAILLQRIESHIVLNKIAPEFIQRFPDTPFITKHDSFLISSEIARQIPSITQLIENKILEVTGLRVHLKIKNRSPFQSESVETNKKPILKFNQTIMLTKAL